MHKMRDFHPGCARGRPLLNSGARFVRVTRHAIARTCAVAGAIALSRRELDRRALSVLSFRAPPRPAGGALGVGGAVEGGRPTFFVSGVGTLSAQGPPPVGRPKGNLVFLGVPRWKARNFRPNVPPPGPWWAEALPTLAYAGRGKKKNRPPSPPPRTTSRRRSGRRSHAGSTGAPPRPMRTGAVILRSMASKRASSAARS